MTRTNKVNKRSVKKSTAITEVVAVLAEVDIGSPSDMIDFAKLPYRKLQAMAKELGVKASGSKADLLERLVIKRLA